MNTSATKSHAVLLRLTESAIMLALATVLSLLPLWKMPMGGSVTLCSMLPIMLIALKYGTPTGLSVAALYTGIQIVQALIEGNVFVCCQSVPVLLCCVLFDYVLPFTLIGLAGIFRKRGFRGEIGGICLVMGIRFLCHFIAGVFVWGQWAYLPAFLEGVVPEGAVEYVYSFIYQIEYMIPELIITVCAAFVLLRVPRIRKLLYR